MTVHIPASYGPSHPVPLLILLHGYSGDGASIDDYFGMAAAAEQHGFVYATPEGTRDGDGNRFWNATDACCDFDHRDVDDVAYLAGVVEEIQQALTIDPKRIAFAGHSNGGFMSHRMACDRPDLVSAIVSLAGVTYLDPADCKAGEPVSVVQAHGTDDDVILYDGGGPVTPSMQPFPGAETTARTWAANDGCDATPATAPERLDLDAILKDGDDPAETTVTTWAGCDAGSSVELWSIEGANHEPRLTPAFAAGLLDFVVDHPKP